MVRLPRFLIHSGPLREGAGRGARPLLQHGRTEALILVIVGYWSTLAFAVGLVQGPVLHAAGDEDGSV